MTEREKRIEHAWKIVRESAPQAAPKPRATPSSGRMVQFLIAKGWSRNPAEFVDECGAETEISLCHHPARWIKDGIDLCAQHAALSEGWRP